MDEKIKERLKYRNNIIKEDENKFLIKKDESGYINSLIRLLLVLDIGSVITPIVLLYLGYILFLAIWIFLTIIINIILIKIFGYYMNYEKTWIFDKPTEEMHIIRKSNKFEKTEILLFENIKYLTYSENALVISKSFYLSAITQDNKKYEIIYGSKQHIKQVGERLADFLEIPLIRKDFYKAEIIFYSSISITSLIAIILFYFIISGNHKLLGLLIGLVLFFIIILLFVLLTFFSVIQYFKQKKRLEINEKGLKI